jgi:hypothetical protein
MFDRLGIGRKKDMVYPLCQGVGERNFKSSGECIDK